MSYEHCDVHNTDATNGCNACENERRSETVDGKQRRWVAMLRIHNHAGVRAAVQRLTDEAILSLVVMWLLTTRGIGTELAEPSLPNVNAFIGWAVLGVRAEHAQCSCGALPAAIDGAKLVHASWCEARHQ